MQVVNNVKLYYVYKLEQNVLSKCIGNNHN